MLPKANRLTRETDFKAVARGSRPIHSPCLILKKLNFANQTTKFGIVISAKVSKKATQRNKVRRRVREILRSNIKKVSSGYKVMLVAKGPILDQDYQALKKELEGLLKKSGLL